MFHPQVPAVHAMAVGGDVPGALDIRGRTECLVDQHSSQAQLESEALGKADVCVDAGRNERDTDLLRASSAQFDTDDPVPTRQPAGDRCPRAEIDAA